MRMGLFGDSFVRYLPEKVSEYVKTVDIRQKIVYYIICVLIDLVISVLTKNDGSY